MKRLTIGVGIIVGLIAIVLALLVYQRAWTKVSQSAEGLQVWENRLSGKRVLCSPAWNPRCQTEGTKARYPSID